MPSPELNEIIASLESTPGLIEQLIRKLRPDQLRLRNTAEEFSALENVCHLRDIELEGYTKRITRILHEDQPALPDIDGGQLAIERDYNQQDPAQSLGEFRQAREKNVQVLRRSNEADFAREGLLEGVGKVNLDRLLEMMLEHDEGHLRELEIIQRRSERS